MAGLDHRWYLRVTAVAEGDAAILPRKQQKNLQAFAFGKLLVIGSFDATAAIWEHGGEFGDYECISTLQV
ncbi:Hypothetical predicted protein [Olea europaea subsp. europaea]|uniref:Uncharacterized protein n=1 Tax=Olea europaea subsp. europaea TaxID=158383 RepID=A0A8S0QSD3_OLEEU|nr:Hypothetical predicted protein [Olea europaea subsp. europaea]